MNAFKLKQSAGLTVALALAAAAATPAAHAQAWPTKQSIRIVITSAPGGGTDAIGRLLAEMLQTNLKQTAVPENRAGAAGVVGSEVVMRSAPDGYTLGLIQNAHTMNPAIVKKLPYDTVADFTPVTTLARSPLVLISGGGTGVKSIRDLIEFAKRSPDKMNYGSAETSIRLATARISSATNTPATLVYYKGTGPTVTDIAGGHLSFAVTTIASTLAQRDRINYVGVLAAERSPFLPNVPTLIEQGLAGIEAAGWWGVIAPANMPRALLQQVNAAVHAAMNHPDARRKLATISAEPWLSSPDDFDKFVRSDIAATVKLAREAGVQPE